MVPWLSSVVMLGTVMLTVGLTVLVLLAWGLHHGSRSPEVAGQTLERQLMAGLAHMRPMLELVVVLFGTAAGWYALFEFSSQGVNRRDAALAEAYAQLGDSYEEVLRLCMAHPQLDCFDKSLADLGLPYRQLTNDEIVQQHIVHAMLINHMEQAFARFRSHGEYWCGWERYIDAYASRPAFQDSWIATADTWGQGFQCFMAERINPNLPEGAAKLEPTGCPLVDLDRVSCEGAP